MTGPDLKDIPEEHRIAAIRGMAQAAFAAVNPSNADAIIAKINEAITGANFGDTQGALSMAVATLVSQAEDQGVPRGLSLAIFAAMVQVNLRAMDLKDAEVAGHG